LKNVIFVVIGLVNAGVYGWAHYTKNGNLDLLTFPAASMACAGIGLLFLVSLTIKVCHLEKNQMGKLSADKETMILAFCLAAIFLFFQIAKEYAAIFKSLS